MLAESAPPPPPGPSSHGRTRASAALQAVTSRPKLAVGAVLGAGAAGYLMLVDPSTSSAYPPCPLKLATGVDCAGCGGLRCTHALLTGDLERAADHNLLLVLALPLLAYMAIRWGAARFGRELPMFRWTPSIMWGVMALLLVFSVVRNLPWGPFPYLFSDADGRI